MDQTVIFELPYKLIDNLNIAYNVLSRKIAFWNKYQIFLCEDIDYKNLDNVREINLTESTIAQLILSANYLICLDYQGAVFVTRLKFKHSAHKRAKGSFEQKENGILVLDYHEDVVYSLKQDSDNLYFCINKMNSEFESYKKFTIILNDQVVIPKRTQRDQYIFRTRVLSGTESEYVKGLFKSDEDTCDKQVLVIVSFDGLSLYALLVDLKSPKLSINIIELFKSPTQISTINFITDNCFNLLVSLTTGTVIKLALNSSLQTPHIVHLNTAIHKLLAIDDALVFTDGVSLWKAENVFSTEIKFKQFNLMYPKDIIRCADELICTTYSKLLYILPLNHDSSYKEDESATEYCSAEKLLNNYDYLNRIMKEIETSNQIVQSLKKEENYLATLALSHRHDVMDDIIQYNITIYESYESVLKEETSITLTNDIKQYFDCNSYCCLVNITTSTLQPKFNDILTNLLGNTQIHMKFTSNKKNLNTVSIKIMEQLDILKLVVPLNLKNIKSGDDVHVNIKLISIIPGALNEKKTLWATIQDKVIVLGVEQFMKTYLTRNIQSLKEPKEPIEDLISQTGRNNHGTLFYITPSDKDLMEWPFYVALPNNYKELFSNKLSYNKHFNLSRNEYLYNIILSEDFLCSNKNITLNILNEVVDINIISDGFSEPLLMVSSTNSPIAFGVRNFFSNIIYNFDNYQNEYSMIVSPTYIETLEKILVDMRSYIEKNSVEEFHSLYGYFQRNVIGLLVV